jgi:septal ring factor EnvC (AmiA/AmiB activator)
MAEMAKSIELHAVHRRIDSHDKRINALEMESGNAREQLEDLRATLKTVSDGNARIERSLSSHMIEEARTQNKQLRATMATLVSVMIAIGAILVTHFLSK